VLIENDANFAVLAEHRIGAARGHEHVVLVTLGTGIGGGLVLDGRVQVGAVARKWGWASPSQFSLAYQERFGVRPSHTLKSH